LESIEQGLRLQGRRLELELGDQLHETIIALAFYYEEKEVEALLPVDEARDLRASNS
jgi:hypothetical protein